MSYSINDFKTAGETLRVNDLRQALYDAGAILMDKVLVNLHGKEHQMRRKVEAKILKNTKNRTILVFKKRRRKNSRKKYGHRQPVSLIRITKIFSKEGKIIAQEELPKKIGTNVIKKSTSENKVEKSKKVVTDVKKKSVIRKKK